MNPTFYFGIVKKNEIVEDVYDKERPKILVAGAGVVTQASVTRMDITPMSRVEAIGYLHTLAMPWMPAKAVPIEDNDNGVAWMWGVWLAAPDDFFADTHEEAYWTPRMIDNYVIDVMRAREPNREERVEFLRL